MVSNNQVGHLRTFSKVVLWSAAAVCVLIFLAVVSTQIEQRILRHRAEQLLVEIDGLQLRRTPWNSAKQEFHHWGKAAEYEPGCDPHQCALKIAVNDFVFNHFYNSDWHTHIDDYLRYRFNLSAESRPLFSTLEKLARWFLFLGIRPANVFATVGTRDGVVWSKGFSVRMEVLSSAQDGRRYEYTLVSGAYVVPQLPETNAGLFEEDLQLHPNYTIGSPSGCMGCIAVWAKFTPYTEAPDVHRLMQFNLSCLSSWRACTEQSDIMPVAWAEHEADRVRLEALRDR